MSKSYAEKFTEHLKENCTAEERQKILESVLTNYMSDDEVRDLCERAGYEEAIQEDYSVTVEFSGSVTYRINASSEEEAKGIGQDMYEEENPYSLVNKIDDFEISAEIDC